MPFPSPVQESESEVAQFCLTLSDPMDRSLPGSSVHGIFQARVLEWGAIAFSVTLTRMAKIKTLTTLNIDVENTATAIFIQSASRHSAV